MGFSRQEYWSRLPFPPPGNLPNPRINPSLLCLLHWQEGSYFNLKGEELQDVRVERYYRENLIQTISEMGKLRLREVKMK